jgi:hypothetical protein
MGSESRERLLAQGWVPAGEVPAHETGFYLMDAPTDADSTLAQGQHYSVFMIRAATGAPVEYFDSPIDSGYSLDNLAPGAPGSFSYAFGILSWEESPAADFDHFTVYGGATGCFSSAIVIDDAVSTTMNVAAAPYDYYFITATDRSGNEGPAASVSAFAGANGPPKGYVLSISAHPNPFNPTTTLRYTLPSRGHVSIGIYDALGARVAELVDEDQDAGAYTEQWNGRDGGGRTMSSGVYFARLRHSAGTKSYKLLLLK